ncbi:MAG: glucose-6-phosphate isomerase [Deltaproteobacteria bacterium]|nr:glucose-6-phosphate isomerase [Deltaproteobacteria bacterium]
MNELYLELPSVGLVLDLRHSGLDQSSLERSMTSLGLAHREMAALEGGAIANEDEGRQVGHYWLRSPAIAPDGLGEAVREGHARRAALAGQLRARYSNLLHVGVGGSALGAQLLVDALGDHTPAVSFLDNLDPDGLEHTTSRAKLEDAAVVFVSKSGSTAEVQVGLAHVRRACADRELELGPRAIAVTCEDSALDRLAQQEGWRGRLPMWSWVGGRTSIFSSAALLTAQFAGADVDAFLEGARLMDAETRRENPLENPAALLALAWREAGADRARAMVVLPYRDRLQLFGRYLQQLVMESVGKAQDRKGADVHQGLTVYGNKGTTDQHAIVQQLRDGPDDCFVTTIEVYGGDPGVTLASGARASDHLSGFAYGTRAALRAVGRRTLSVGMDRMDARSLGALVALYERAVGLYASLHDINAYHQPGVEAGKRAASEMLELQARLLAILEEGERGDAAQLSGFVEADEDAVFHVLRHLSATGRAGRSGSGLGSTFFSV